MPATCGLIYLAALLIFTPILAPSQDSPVVQIDTAAACEKLQALRLPEVVSISSQSVAAGQSGPTGGMAPLPTEKVAGLPPFCRVRLVAKLAPKSSIQIEIWLPEAHWNGRFLGTGTGGGAGAVNFDSLGPGIKRGFATANTDLGTAPSANLVAGSPDKWADFGYRATHEMTLLSKAVVAAFYGVTPKRSYFVGCSTGGQQALSEAQRYPTDYNGIIAGAPANNRTHLHSEFLWHYQATHKDGDGSLLPPEVLTQITEAVVSSCAGKDGGAPSDNFLTDPRSCKFDLDSLSICTAKVVTHCLTQGQLAAIRMIYKGPVNPVTGERIYAPMPFGSEASPGGISYQENWSGAVDLMYPFQWALGKRFDPATFDFNKDEAQLDDKLAPIVNANNPDLQPFEENGGKLIMFTGTADALVPFPDAINYYERVVAFTEQHPLKGSTSDPLLATQEFFRYYLVPGMAHCGSGPGVVGIGQGISEEGDDLLGSLQKWTEHDSAPGEIEGVGETNRSNGETMRRRICPYPSFPTYIGGNANDEASFRCEKRSRRDVAVPAARYRK
jgi:feruloyl esterase